LKIKILEQDGRQDIFLPQAERKELKLIRERLIGLLPTLPLDKEKEIEVAKIKRIPTTRSYFFGISSESESGEFDPQMTQTIKGVINTVLSQTRRKKSLKKGGEKR
jgi:hypothetical protein